MNAAREELPTQLPSNREDQLDQPSRPRVLIVDDSDQIEPSQLRQIFGNLGVDVRLRHPEETLKQDLDWAQLVVVDYFLKDWPERDETESVARSPHDGLAAAATMRSALLPPLAGRHPGLVPPKSVAFAVWSSNLSEASFDLPEVVLPHVFSRENGLEWAFNRADALQRDQGSQIAILALAVASLPESWPSDSTGAERQLVSMLNLEKGQEAASADDLWQLDAIVDALDCRPPIHELSERSHGLALIKWLLHRIFPYPCFLLDEQRLCARLRIESLDGGQATGDSLENVLRPFEYSGVLAGFGGRRWWRAGVEDWLFNQTAGESGNPLKVAALAIQHGAQTSQTWMRPVVVIDASLRNSDVYSEVEQTVRVRPDDWPVFADDAFALRALAREDPNLKRLVDPVDRELLDLPFGSSDLGSE